MSAAVKNDGRLTAKGRTDQSQVIETQTDHHSDSSEGNANRQTSPCNNPVDKSRHPLTLSAISPSMALKMSFADWRQASSDNMLATAETLLDELEGVADLLTQIDEKLITGEDGVNVGGDQSIVQRFHDGVESARRVVGALKREKWRLNKREMSVELKMGELEEYKSHLKNDMTSLNQTVDVLSLRIVQLENQLVEAQEVQESLEAECADYKKKAEEAENRCKVLKKENESLVQDLKLFTNHTSHTLATENTMLKNEILILQDENKRLKELVRSAEVHPNQDMNANSDDQVARLTRDFLTHLSNLDNGDPLLGKTNCAPPSSSSSSSSSSLSSSVIQQKEGNKSNHIQAK